MWNKRFLFEENYCYHIFNRWYEKQTLFFSSSDYEKFFKYLAFFLNEFKGITLVSYCVLPNHFHFILSQNETGLILSEFMRKLSVSYAMYFKKKYETGLTRRWQPVFEGRFKAKFIKDEEYIVKCQSYVNYNAQKHGMVDNVEDWPYTSLHKILETWKVKFDNIKIFGYSKDIENYQDEVIDELEV